MPKVAVPVVVMAPDPTSIEVNPEVIDPAFNAPTVTMFACPVIGANASFIRVLPWANLTPVTIPLELILPEDVIWEVNVDVPVT